jgi:hypothetical protein
MYKESEAKRTAKVQTVPSAGAGDATGGTQVALQCDQPQDGGVEVGRCGRRNCGIMCQASPRMSPTPGASSLAPPLFEPWKAYPVGHDKATSHWVRVLMECAVVISLPVDLNG